MDIQKFKGLLVEKEKTYGDCAKVLNITKTAFSNKMNNKSKFNIDEINKLKLYLEIDNERAIDIFLS